MSTVITMKKGNKFRTFVLSEDGTAKEKNKSISDFATRFIQLAENGWRKMSEVSLAFSTNDVNDPIYVRPTESFRDEWDEYLSEYSDNLELEYA